MMERFEKFFMWWAAVWTALSITAMIAIWGYAWFTNVNQPPMNIIVVGILGGLGVFLVTVVLPGLVYGGILETRSSAIPKDPGLVDGAGI